MSFKDAVTIWLIAASILWAYTDHVTFRYPDEVQDEEENKKSSQN